MRVLLIQSPPREMKRESIVVPPLGIAYLAAVIEKSGHKAFIIDAFAERLDINSLEQKIKLIAPDVIGLTGMTPVIDNTVRTSIVARKYAKYVVIGGPHVSIAGDKIFENGLDIDFAIQGEAETSFPLLLSALERSKDVNGIQGLITRDFQNPAAQPIDDLDSIPFPARHLLPNEKYKYILSKGRVTTIFSSRGCPYHCIFCDKAVFGSKWRHRSAANVLDEIESAIKDFGVKSIVFYDDLFTLKADRVVEICQGILDRGLDVEWKCEGRVNIVDEKVLKWMKKAGCTMIAYGVESGNQKGLDYLNKGTKIEQIKRAFRMTINAGIKPMAYFVLGIPVETYDDEIRTIEFAKEIKADYAQFSILSPVPGTKLYDEALKMGWYREVDVQNPMDKDLKRPAIINENWDEEKLNKILVEAHKRFYLSFRYVWKSIRELRNSKEFVDKSVAGLKLLMWYFSKLTTRR